MNRIEEGYLYSFEQLENMRKLLLEIDLSNDGVIEWHEIDEAEYSGLMHSKFDSIFSENNEFGFPPFQVDEFLQTLYQSEDLDRDGQITINELMVTLERLRM